MRVFELRLIPRELGASRVQQKDELSGQKSRRGRNYEDSECRGSP